MDSPTCPRCGSEEATLLGRLGPLTWLRCRRCGSVFELDAEWQEALNPSCEEVDNG